MAPRTSDFDAMYGQAMEPVKAFPEYQFKTVLIYGHYERMRSSHERLLERAPLHALSAQILARLSIGRYFACHLPAAERGAVQGGRCRALARLPPTRQRKKVAPAVK